MTAKFVSCSGVVHRVLLTGDDGSWLIAYEDPGPPIFISEQNLERIPAPEGFLEGSKKELTEAQRKRMELIQPLLDARPETITDRSRRLALAKEIADQQGTTARRILRLYYRYLAQNILTSEKKRAGGERNSDFDWAIKTFYYSAKKFSLRASYEMMLVQRFSDADGALLPQAPTWSAFQHYFYKHNYHKEPQKVIARQGLTYYQRNCKPAFGSARQWKPAPGAFQMDETPGDIYLVSRLDRSSVIGRPCIYLAVDTATQLIAGVYVGLESDETAVMKCLENAAMDKVAYCRKIGIAISAEQWPNMGLPDEIISDKGREFFGPRMEELCQRYGVEIESLPPFRPDQKGLVEKTFDLIQQKYKPLLRGKGVIEPDAQERWSVDYRSQAVLDLDEFTAVVLHCIIFLNSGYVFSDGRTAAQRWLEASPNLLNVPAEELHSMTLPRVKAKLTRKGFRVNGFWYAPTDNEGLYIGDTYLLAYDPADIRTIFLVKKDSELPCQLVRSQVTEECAPSLEEAAQARTKCREAKRDAERQAQQASVSTARSIAEIARQAQAKSDGSISKQQTGEDIQKNRIAERRRLS